MLLFCADWLKWYDAFRYAGCNPRLPGEGDLIIAVDDALIAAQNTVVAAHSYGIGSCYIGDVCENIEAMRALLALPEYVFPVALLVFGYPTDQQMEREKPARCDIRYIVQENRYQRMNKEQLQDMLAKGKTKEEYDIWIRNFCKRKYHSDFAEEMTRSMKKYLIQYSRDMSV